MKLDILVFGAHPDDAELGAGGTIAKSIAQGKRVGVIDLTRGELGTRGTAQIRDQEAKAAAKILGLTVRENLQFADGFFENNKAHQLKVIEKIRLYKPKVVLCNAVTDRHIDHSKGAKLVADACFLSGLVKIDTFYNNQQQDPWRPKAVYHYIQWQNLQPNFVVNIDTYIEAKIKAIEAYASQFYNPNSKEPETPISSKNFIDSVKYRARDLGRVTGVQYAEGFTTNKIIGVNDLESLF